MAAARPPGEWTRFASTKLRIAVVAVSLGALFAPAVWRRSSGEVRVRAVRTGSGLAVVEVSRGTPVLGRPAALLVHGFQCNASMMVPLARQLAAAGIDAYAISLPGHGASLDRFSAERAIEATREAIAGIAAKRDVSRDRIALVGHSYGASVLARAVAGERTKAPLVLIGPAYAGGLSPATANVLVVTGERDYPFITASARHMLRDATAGAIDGPERPVGDARHGDARVWRVVPGEDHLSLLVSDRVSAEVLEWVRVSLGPVEPVETRLAARVPLALSFLALAGAAVLALLGARAASAWASASRDEATGTLASRIAIGVAAVALAIPLARFAPPLASIRLLEGEQIVSLFAVAGVIANALALFAWRRSLLPTLPQLARAVPVALGAFAILYAAAVLGLDRELYRLSLDGAPGRRGAAVLLAFALLPFFAVVQALSSAAGSDAGPAARWRRVAVPTVAVATLYAAVAAALPLLGPRIGRFTAAVLGVGAFCALAGALLGRAARNATVGTTFSALTTAWLVAVGFVRY